MLPAHELPAFVLVPHGTRIFNIAYAGWGLSEVWIFARDRRGVVGRNDDRGSLWLLIGAIVAAMALAFWAVRFGGAAIAAPPVLLLGAGVALMLGGMVFRLWAVQTLGRFFRVAVTMQDDHRLIEAGPYRWLRNPSYTGALVTMAGLGIAIGNWLSVAAMVGLPLIGFLRRIKVEEASLAANFGVAWSAFSARRAALIPFIW